MIGKWEKKNSWKLCMQRLELCKRVHRSASMWDISGGVIACEIWSRTFMTNKLSVELASLIYSLENKQAVVCVCVIGKTYCNYRIIAIFVPKCLPSIQLVITIVIYY
jgi:hypothetical protein